MNDELKRRLCEDLNNIGLPIEEVEFSLRPYSKTYRGRYFPSYKGSVPKIYIYPYEYKGVLYSYEECLEVAIHEMVHHLQHSNPNWKRYKGIMHDTEFWKLFNMYIFRAKILEVIPYECKTA